MSFCVCFQAFISALSASFSATSRPVNDHAEALSWALIDCTHLDFWILSDSFIESESSSITCSAKPNKILLVLIYYSLKHAFAKPVSPFFIYISCCFKLEISLDCYDI